jgi:hypothetical protein
MSAPILVFIHGYSVTNLDTYGELPLRIKAEAATKNISLQTADIFLARYISFHDEVVLEDVARALEHAVNEQLQKNQRYIFITHSTGAPLVRLWWHNFYQVTKKICPMSHLIMLAPANFGSSLAQLGKSKLSRLKNFLDGLEPGQGILNWLELGSAEARMLNKNWILNSENAISTTAVYPFVITAQSIDRKMYDHINSYTGEPGTDGVIRVSSANLNAHLLSLVQKEDKLEINASKSAYTIPFKVLLNRSHSGDKMGIMRSVKKEPTSDAASELIESIFDCIAVDNQNKYTTCMQKFAIATANNQAQMQVEQYAQALGSKTYIHDKYSQVIITIKDDQGHAVTDFDLVFTGNNDDADLLPEGFLKDRQINTVNRNVLSFYFNYDSMFGCAAVKSAEGKVLRKSQKGLSRFGIKILPRPNEGFVRYAACSISGTTEFLQKVLHPNASTLIEIELTRLVSNQNLRFEKVEDDRMPKMVFKDIRPGTGIA